MIDSAPNRIIAYLQIHHLASCAEMRRDLGIGQSTLTSSLHRLAERDLVRAWPEQFIDSIGGNPVVHYFRTLNPCIKLGAERPRHPVCGYLISADAPSQAVIACDIRLAEALS